MEVVVHAPAKINYTLSITGKLPNNYHTVDMIMQSVSLYDEVKISNQEQGITLSCNWDFIPCNNTNTAYKAAEEFFKTTGINKGVHIHIEKVIPSEAGLAGGSADAGAVLVGLNALFDAKLSTAQIAEIGARVGADVPFCIYGGTMRATGIGTTLELAQVPMPNFKIIICKPKIGVSTKKAYELADSREYVQESNSIKCIKALQNLDLNAFSKSIYNDFEELLDLEEVNIIKKIMNNAGALCSSMSGSGAAVFGMFLDLQKAEQCRLKLQALYDDVFIVEPINFGCRIVQVNN